MCDTRKEKRFFRINLFFAFFCTIVLLWSYVSDPSEVQSAVFLGFSLFRLLVVLLIFFFLILIVIFFVHSYKAFSWISEKSKVFTKIYNWTPLPTILIIIIASSYFILFSSELVLGIYASYQKRLVPLAIWGIVLGIQVLVMITITRAPKKALLRQFRGVPVFFLFLLFVVAFISWSRIGLEPDTIYWQNAGVPILFYQVIGVWGIGSLHCLLLNQKTSQSWLQILKKMFQDKRFVFFVLWFLAATLWLQEPLRPSYNSLKPLSPNFQAYPFADALYYDTHAQQYLIGEAIPNHLWIKPLYTFFLSILHLLLGQNFSFIVNAQVIFLALIPAFIYLLVSHLGNQSVGVTVSLLFIVRELNGISLSNIIQVSNSKYLLSDVFGVLLMVFVLLFLIISLKYSRRFLSGLFLTGSFLGLFVLTRGNAILLLPVIIVIMAIVSIYYKKKPWVKGYALLIFGLLITLSPWLWRNYKATGRVILQDPPSVFAGQLANLYSYEPTTDFGILMPGETESEYKDRTQKQIQEFIVEHPDEVLRFTASHFSRNLIFSYVYLPQSFQIENVRSYVKRLPFDSNWEGNLNVEGWLFLLINLAVLSIGAKALWEHSRILAAIPVLILLGYNLSISVSRLSGWRFVMTSDWIVLIFFSAGLIQVTHIFISIWMKNRKEKKVEAIAQTTTGNIFSFSFFELFVLSIPFWALVLTITAGHTFFSLGSVHNNGQVLISDFSSIVEESSLPYSEEELDGFLYNENVLLVSGKALYPTNRESGMGEYNVLWPSLLPMPHDRITFYLIGSRNIGVVLNQNPFVDNFPDEVEVIVLGCLIEDTYVDYIDGLVVYAKTSPPQVLVAPKAKEHLSCLP